MYLTGFADEAAQGLAGQIKATKELGWNAIESRGINGNNIHDIPDDAFERACEQLEDAKVHVNCFGSTIANWGKKIEEPFDTTLAELDRAVPRMQRLGTKLIRIMSYARRDGDDQMAEERFRRLRLVTKRFTDAGITPVHENCMNYGGMSWQHTKRMLEAVPGLKLVYDTGNPVITRDWSKGGTDYQDPWEFYSNVRPHIAYVHIKDVVMQEGNEVYRYAGDGDGHIFKILQDLKDSNYDGGLSIEPHMAAVFHNPEAGRKSEDESYAIYLEYGRRVMTMLEEIGYRWQPYS